jgi:peptide-methionine (S)-S-oxide reductase
MSNLQQAIFGGGCFWCIEAIFQRVQGVESVASGYMGGTNPNPTYKQVCGGDTGHVEVVKITFNPEQVSYRELLDIFFTVHDPTTLNRQGNDAGTQYRSVIFYTSDEQRRASEEFISQLESSKAFGAPVITAVEPAAEFYQAEDYHQNYFNDNRYQPYCMFVVGPKVQKFQQKFGEKLQA